MHHVLNAKQKLMMCLLMKQIISTLQYPCNLIEYSDIYSDTSESLWQCKRYKVLANNADLTVDNNGVFNSQSFKYKAAFVGKTADVADVKNNAAL